MRLFHPEGPTFMELAEQALSSTERGYDLLAPRFDHTPFRTPDELLQRVAERLPPVDAALDICCGTGAAMRILRPLCRSRVVGIDFSQGMLDEARRRLSDAPGTASIELIRSNALAMPFDAEFDLAVCFGAFGHILPADEPAFIREVSKALRPGGQFVFVTGYMPPWWTLPRLIMEGFNFAITVRNLVKKPPFIMYYLTFLLPRATALLQAAGFEVESIPNVFAPPFQRLFLVLARKPS